MNRLPSDTVTFLFTDIEGTTGLWQELPEATAILMRDMTRSCATRSNHGYIFQIVGDSFCVAFPTAIDGLRAAII